MESANDSETAGPSDLDLELLAAPVVVGFVVAGQPVLVPVSAAAESAVVLRKLETETFAVAAAAVAPAVAAAQVGLVLVSAFGWRASSGSSCFLFLLGCPRRAPPSRLA